MRAVGAAVPGRKIGQSQYLCRWSALVVGNAFRFREKLDFLQLFRGEPTIHTKLV